MVALNTAFTKDGALIKIDNFAHIEEAIELYNITTCPGIKMIQPRHHIEVGEGAEVTFVESYHNLCVGSSFTNAVNTIKVGKNANLHYIKIEHPKRPNTYIIDHTLIEQAANSTLNLFTVTLSGDLVRNHLHVTVNGEHASTNLMGLYVLNKNNHGDNKTTVDHAVPNCYSNELYKGILGGTSTGVFNGKIIVREDAQKTNAYQNNRNILVSDEATINTQPQLEIFADDVKCSHGATSAQIDDSELFYLRARGIGKEKARGLLMFAFAEEIIEKIKNESARQYLENEVAHALGIENYSEK
jgi:Fe-S cluster assembly protein SufD